MSLKKFPQRIFVAGLLATTVGVALADTTTPPKADATAPAATEPTVIQIPPQIVTVNGAGLSSSEFIQDLYAIAGPRVLEEQINLFCARDACRLSGITLAPKDMDAEVDRLVKNLVATITPPLTKELTKDEKDNLLGQFAQSKGMNPLELGLQLQQRAFLRALGKAAKDQDGKPAVNVTDENLNDEFEHQNGDRANVTVYIFPDREAAATVMSDATKEKKTFSAMADEMKTPRQPVVIPTSDSVKFEPAIFKTLVKQTKEKDISAITQYTNPADSKTVYVVLYVDKIVPKTAFTPEQAGAEKAKLKDLLIDQAQVNVGMNIVNSMRESKQIAVVIHDPILSRMYEQIQKAQQEQRDNAAKAATAPGVTTTAPAGIAPAKPPH